MKIYLLLNSSVSVANITHKRMVIIII